MSFFHIDLKISLPREQCSCERENIKNFQRLSFLYIYYYFPPNFLHSFFLPMPSLLWSTFFIRWGRRRRSAQEKLTDVLCCCLILFHLSFISFHFTPFLVAHQRFLLTLTGCFFLCFSLVVVSHSPTSPHTQFDTKIEQCRVYKHTNGEAKVSCFGCFLSSVQQHNSSNNRAKEAHNEFGMKLQEKRNYKFHFVKRHLIWTEQPIQACWNGWVKSCFRCGGEL